MRQKLGQHFLKNKSAITTIITALDPQKGETIIEIGGGHGELTYPLLEACTSVGAKLIVIEKDIALAEKLEMGNEKLEVIRDDALTILSSLVSNLSSLNPYKVTGNLPYYISGFLMRILADIEPKPIKGVFMLQKEVGERIAAQSPKMNLLAAITQLWAEPKLLQTLTPKDFSPPPKVDSIIIELATHQTPQLPITELPNYYRFVKILFKQPRKTILNNLSDGTGLSKESVRTILKKEGLTGEERAQILTLTQLLTLSRCF